MPPLSPAKIGILLTSPHQESQRMLFGQ